MAYDMGHLDLRASIRVRDDRTDRQVIETSVGRIIFNEVIPEELGFHNKLMDKKAIKDLVSEGSRKLDSDRTAVMVDRIGRWEPVAKSVIFLPMPSPPSGQA